MEQESSPSLRKVAALATVAVVGIGFAAAVSWYRGGSKKTHFSEVESAPEETSGTVASSNVGEDVDIFFWAAAELRRQHDVPKILNLLRDLSASDKVIGIIEGGCLDALLTVIASDAESVLFIYANAARNPASHRFFFSGRFSYEPFLKSNDEKTRNELLRLMLNLTYDRFASQMSVSKLNVRQALSSLSYSEKNRDNLLLIEKVQRNLNADAAK